MNDHVQLERSIAEWMADEGRAARDDATLDQILSTTGRARPQPRWLVLLKEPPMRLNTRVAVGSPTRWLVLVALVTLLVLAAAAAVAALVMRPPVADDWPSVRGSSARTGVAVSGPVGRPSARWTFHAGAAVTTNIAIADGLVIASSDDGVLHALALADGSERWSYDAGTSMTGPSVADGMIYVTDGHGAVDALKVETGMKQWSKPAGLVSATTAATGDGRVYVATGDGLVVAFDARTGDERWRATLPTAGTLMRTPAFADGLVYAASRGSGLVALDAGTGSTRWTADLGGDDVGTPVIANGLVWTGTPGEATARLRTFDANTGAPVGTISDSDYAPAISDAMAVTGSTDGRVTARDAKTGAANWRFVGQGPIRGPSIAGGVVYFDADAERRLYALDGATGNEFWSFDVDATSSCCISVAQGVVVLGTSAGTIYAIAGDGSPMVAQAHVAQPTPTVTPASASASAAPASASAAPPLPDPFTVDRTVPLDQLGIDGPLGIAVGPNGLVYVSDRSDHVSAISADGTVVHRWGGTGSGKGQLDFTPAGVNSNSQGSLAVGPDGTVYVSDSDNHRVQAFTAKGAYVRQFGSIGSDPGEFATPFDLNVDGAGNVYVEDDENQRLTAFSPSGDVLWVADGSSDDRLRGHGHSPSFDPKGRLVVSDDDNGIVAYLDPATGKVVDSFQGNGCDATVDAAGNVYVDDCGGGHVSVFGPDHALIAQSAGQLLGSPRFAPDGTAFALAPDGSLLVLSVKPPRP